MADVALRGIPESLHRELKAAAKRNHRSLNGEILSRLSASLRPTPVDAVGFLDRIERRHRTLGPLELDEASLRRLRSEGPDDEGRSQWRGGE